MATVIGNIAADEDLRRRYDIAVWPSFVGGNPIVRTLRSEVRLMRFRANVPAYDVYHLHVAAGRSLWRKLRYLDALGDLSGHAVLHIHASTFDVFFDALNEKDRRSVRDRIGKAAAVILLSEEWREYFLSRRICPEERIAVLHNAVSIPVSNRTDYASQNVLFMGRMGERKSPDVLLKAAARVIPNHPSARFTFGGDGEVETYRKLAADLGIADSCEFLGWVSGEERESAYLGASIYCLPSKNEGMPMSVLEAMSYGLATISTPVGGMPQVIDDGVNGLFFPVDDIGALAQQLDMLLSSASERLRLGEAGRCKVSEKFAMDAYGRRLARIYEEVCS